MKKYKQYIQPNWNFVYINFGIVWIFVNSVLYFRSEFVWTLSVSLCQARFKFLLHNLTIGRLRRKQFWKSAWRDESRNLFKWVSSYLDTGKRSKNIYKESWTIPGRFLWFARNIYFLKTSRHCVKTVFLKKLRSVTCHIFSDEKRGVVELVQR